MQPRRGHDEVFPPTGKWTKEVAKILLCPFTAVIYETKSDLWVKKSRFLLHLTSHAGSPDLTCNCFVKAYPQMVTLQD